MTKQDRLLLENGYKDTDTFATTTATTAHYDAECEKESKERKRNWKAYISNCIAQSAAGGKRKHRKEKKRKRKRK